MSEESLDKKKYQSEKPSGATIVLDSSVSSARTEYKDTPLPFDRSSYQPPREVLPEKLRQMRRLYTYGRESLEGKAKNFCKQGKFMEDFEDDAPWSGPFLCYYPTYQDLTTKQLRGYFSWRTRVRQGKYEPLPTSAAYLYIYELLNGIGTSSPEDSLEKMKAFEAGYLDSGIGDPRMRKNLRRWMLEFAVIWNLPQEQARQYADPELLERDHALAILRDPEGRPEEEIFSALSLFGGKRLTQSPVLTAGQDRGKTLFAKAWQKAAALYRQDGKDLFTLCFGKRVIRAWHPLANAVYDGQGRLEDRDFVLNECRAYYCKNGIWRVSTYEKLGFDKARLQGFLREADRILRLYLKTGHYLRENPADLWAAPFIEAAAEEDRQALIEASRPKISIDLAGLAKIREDSLTTRDSLLTEEERLELEETEEAVFVPESDFEESGTDLSLDEVHLQILRTLLQERSVEEYIRKQHRMPSIVADTINEALYDEIGDVVVLCEDDELSLVEDYREDIAYLLGGRQA